MNGSPDEIRKSHEEARCASAAGRLVSRGFDARFFHDAESCIEAVLEAIPPGSDVGAGGSVTLRETGLLDTLAGRGDRVVYHRAELGIEGSLRARREALTCDFYLTSSNAVTMEGELVNVDGVGNRVAGMIFGPATVIVLAGSNKLVADRQDALNRIRNVAAPANARRLGLDLPCVEHGRCVDCRSPLNICRVTTIINMKPLLTDLKVFLVAEPLGL